MLDLPHINLLTNQTPTTLHRSTETSDESTPIHRSTETCHHIHLVPNSVNSNSSVSSTSILASNPRLQMCPHWPDDQWGHPSARAILSLTFKQKPPQIAACGGAVAQQKNDRTLKFDP